MGLKCLLPNFHLLAIVDHLPISFDAEITSLVGIESLFLYRVAHLKVARVTHF
jgi:hypothetical protein